jgi:hypothetical protein
LAEGTKVEIPMPQGSETNESASWSPEQVAKYFRELSESQPAPPVLENVSGNVDKFLYGAIGDTGDVR